MLTLAEPGDERQILHFRMADLLAALQHMIHDVNEVFVFEPPCREVREEQLPELKVHQLILNVRCHFQNVVAIVHLAVHAEPPENSNLLLGVVDPCLQVFLQSLTLQDRQAVSSAAARKSLHRLQRQTA